MNAPRLLPLATLGLIFLAACQPQPPRYSIDPSRLDGSAGVVERSVQSIGGPGAWRGARRITYVTVLTLYDAQGQAYISRQTHELDLWAGTMSATGVSPRGIYKVTLDAADRCVVDPDCAPLGGAELRRVCLAMRLLRGRVLGPLNLLAPPVTAGVPARVRQAGMDVVRVPVAGEPNGAIAYYFDPSTSLLQFFTVGSEQPKGGGTLTFYQWAPTPGGLAFPASIRVVHAGQNVLLGDTLLLEASLSDVIIR